MSLVASVLLAAAPATVPACSWDRPGVNPFMGDVVAAVDRYPDIPAEVRGRLKARMAKRQYDEIAVIKRDEIIGKVNYAPDIRDMHFGAGQICKTVTRQRWTPEWTERGLVYCESDHCIIVPTVCRNVSRISRRDAALTPDQQQREFAAPRRPLSPEEAAALANAPTISSLIAQAQAVHSANHTTLEWRPPTWPSWGPIGSFIGSTLLPVVQLLPSSVVSVLDILTRPPAELPPPPPPGPPPAPPGDQPPPGNPPPGNPPPAGPPPDGPPPAGPPPSGPPPSGPPPDGPPPSGPPPDGPPPLGPPPDGPPPLGPPPDVPPPSGPPPNGPPPLGPPPDGPPPSGPPPSDFPIPEPSILGLVGLAIAALGVARLKRWWRRKADSTQSSSR